MDGYIVAGIGTEVGKTVVAAVLVQALDADYWKPVQAGELHNTDSDVVRELTSGPGRKILPETYRLTQPMSPHAAAFEDQVTLDADKLVLPDTDRILIVELAGGLMVPLAPGFLNIDLVERWNLPVVLVSSYYLGSINHTLLSVSSLRQRGIPIAGLVFNGEPVPSTRSVILDESGLSSLLDMPQLPVLNAEAIASCAHELQLPQ